MISKIKMLAKRALRFVKKLWNLVKNKIDSPKCRELIGKLRAFGKKLHDAVKGLWQTRETRVLLILIAAVLTLLVVVVSLFFNISWSNTVGICYASDTVPSNAAYRQLLEQSLAKQGFEVIVTDADGSVSKQLAQISDLADRRCDAILVEPVDAGEEITAAVEKTGLPAVLLGCQENERTVQLPAVGAGVSQYGAMLGQMVLSLPESGDINGDGVVSYLLIQGAEQDTEGTALSESFEAYLTESGVTSQLLETDCGNWTGEGGQSACSRQLAAYGKDIEVILCTSDQMAIGAVAAIEDGGRNVGQDVYLYGVGYQTEALRLIGEGMLSGTVYIDYAQQVGAVLDNLLAQLGGPKTEDIYEPFCTAVTAENISQYISE